MNIHIKPDSDISYLIALKYNKNPFLSSFKKTYDTWKILCPKDLSHESYFRLFSNMSNTAKYSTSKYSAFGLRELNQTEHDTYCLGTTKYNSSEPPILDSEDTDKFKVEFSYRVFSQGCYYIDKSTGNWLSDGVDVFEDSTFEYLHCKSTHLTDFAGGLVVLPPTINFDEVFRNASFEKTLLFI